MPGTDHSLLWANIDRVVAGSDPRRSRRKRGGCGRETERNTNQNDQAITSFAISLFRLALMDVGCLER